MSNYKVSGEDLSYIAETIRTKGGTSADLSFPSDFISAILNIPSGGGGGNTYPPFDAIYGGTISGGIGAAKVSIEVAIFFAYYAVSKALLIKPISQVLALGSVTVFEDALPEPTATQGEYSGNIYGNSGIITNCGLALLGDFSQGGAASGNALSDSIENYSGVILQGIYNKQRTSGYNTSMLYLSPSLDTQYWAGMKDRNTSYDCRVTFTDNTHCSLNGTKQVIIYGIP